MTINLRQINSQQTVSSRENNSNFSISDITQNNLNLFGNLSLSDLSIQNSFIKPEIISSIKDYTSSINQINNLENTTEDFVRNNFNNDLIYKSNLSSEFVVNSLKVITSNEQESFRNVSYPNVLTHDIIKVRYQPELLTNESSLQPSVLFSIKESYYNNVHLPNSSRFFLYGKNSEFFRSNHINKTKENKLLIDLSYREIEDILDIKNNIKSKNNFGNIISDFYLNNQTSSSLGKIASIILDNNKINLEDVSKNNKSINERINYFFYNTLENSFNSFQPEDMNKIYDLLISKYLSKNSYLKDSSKNNFIVNSDRIIGQILLNSSVSLYGFFKDSLSYDFWGNRNSSNNNKIQLLDKVIDSEVFNRIPILKLNSVLSLELENNSKGIFNNFNYDEKIYSLNNNIFNLGIFPEFNSLNNLVKDKSGNYSSLNQETFNTFNKSLYLTNRLSNKNSIITNNSLLEDIVNKEKYVSNLERNNDYVEKYFNPFFISNIILRDPSLAMNTVLSYSVFESDIHYLNHNLDVHKSILNKISSRKYVNKKSKSILSGPKFIYSSGKTKDFNIEDDYHKINIYDNLNESFNTEFYFRNIDYICVDDFETFENNETFDSSIRKNIVPIEISLNYNILRDYFKKNENYNYKDIILKPEGDNDRESSLKLKEELLKLFKGDNNSFENLLPESEGLLGLEEDLRRNKDKINLSKGFVLLKNTMNEISINNMKDKFINLDNNLTHENEFFNDRIIKKSSSFNQHKESNTELIVDDLKLNSFKKDRWEKISFDLRKNFFNLKKKKLKDNKVLNYMLDFKNKAKKINNNFKESPYLSLLYSNLFEKSFENLENSEFIISDQNNFYNKFNFSDSDNIENSIESIINSITDNPINDNFQSDEDNLFPINSNDLKEFVSKFYSDSELKNSSVYFNYILKKTYEILDFYTGSESIYRHDLAYDKLLSDIIIHDNSQEVYNTLAISSLAIHKNIILDNEDFDTVNQKTEENYENYLKKIYSFENIKRQKSYTLRTVEYPNVDLSFYPQDNSESILISKLSDHLLDVGVLPGSTYSLCFPFVSSTYKTNVTGNNNCSLYGINKDQIIKFNTFTRENISGSILFDSSKISGENDSLEGLYEFIYSNFYNYDVYLDKSSKTIGDEEDSTFSFNKQENKAHISNIIRPNKGRGSDNVFNERTNYKNYIINTNQTRQAYSSENPKTFDSIINSLNYTRYGISFKDYALGSNSYQPLFKSFINENIIEMLKFVDSDFETNILNIENLEDILEYVNSKESELKIIFNIIRCSCNLYSTMFDNIIEGSILKNLNKVLEDSEYNGDVNKLIWDKQVFNLYKFNNLFENNFIYKFEKNILSEDSNEFSNGLYTKFHADIQYIQRSLNNSDIMEIMSFDSISSYLVEFEKFIGDKSKFFKLTNKISTLNNKLNIENSNELIEDKLKLNIISKNLNDYSYYQNKEYYKLINLINSDISLNLEQHFENIILNDPNSSNNFFSTILEREKNRNILAFQSINLINSLNLKYDVIKLGIDYSLAKFLSDNKLLKIKCHVVNHKYPNLFIPPIYKFYTPILTEITPSHLKLLENNRNYEEGLFIDNFIGLYDYNSNDLRQRYNVVSVDQAEEFLVKKLFNNINNERLFRNETEIISDDSLSSLYLNTFKVIKDSIYSNAIKYTNYRNQKNIDEKNIKNNGESINQVSLQTREYYNTMSRKEFEETFLESYRVSQEVIDNLNNKLDIIDQKSYFLDFFNLINEYSDIDNVLNNFRPGKFYDVFSFIISREEIKSQIIQYYSDQLNEDSDNFDIGLERIVNSEDFYNSFSYMIEAEIV